MLFSRDDKQRIVVYTGGLAETRIQTGGIQPLQAPSPISFCLMMHLLLSVAQKLFREHFSVHPAQSTPCLFSGVERILNNIVHRCSPLHSDLFSALHQVHAIAASEQTPGQVLVFVIQVTTEGLNGL